MLVSKFCWEDVAFQILAYQMFSNRRWFPFNQCCAVCFPALRVTWPHFNVQNPGLRAAPNKSQPISSVSVAYEISRFRKDLLKLKFIHFHLSKTHKARIFHLNYEHFVPFGKKRGGITKPFWEPKLTKKNHQLPLSASPLRLPSCLRGGGLGPSAPSPKSDPNKKGGDQ